MGKRVAVMLSGCGVRDGSEIHEAVLTLLALDSAGADAVCCAPNVEQAEVVNHLSGAPSGEKRNVLVESARIARGRITDLSRIRAADHDALILPGGMGAAGNLCSYARDGAAATINPEVERVLREFAAAGKPIGAMCIAPVTVARAFKGAAKPPTLTIGTDENTARDVCAFGATHVPCSAAECVVDKANRIVSTPAYMLCRGPAELAAGIDKLVRAVLELCGER